jgi:hypothetical protein
MVNRAQFSRGTNRDDWRGRSPGGKLWARGACQARSVNASTLSLGIKPMAKESLRSASGFCLAIWVAVWLLFLLLRFSTLDIRVVPGAGPIMLIALAATFFAPIAATGLAAAALFRQPGAPLGWLLFGFGIAALFTQVFVFSNSRWL